MRKDEGLVAQRFGRLVVSVQIPTREPNARGAPRYYRCVCDCGQVTEVRGYSLVAGAVQSCGCLQKEHAAAAGRARGGKASGHGAMIGVSSGNPRDPALFRAHNIWRGMIRRCHDPKMTGYKDYGGRGISVCAEWRASFTRFIADMSVPALWQSIERSENDGNYEPDNCEWVGRERQANNTRTNRVIEFNGRALTVSEWARELNLSVQALFSRLKRGWSIDRALTSPVR